MLSARSISEARLYVDLQPCGECGGSWLPLRHTLELSGGQPIAVYAADCASCGRRERFEFLLPREIETSSGYGGEGRSQILDAGEFLWASDRYASLAYSRSGASALEDRAGVAELLERAVYAMEEVAKFVPEGADRVPPEDITSELGRSVYESNPDRVRVGHIEFELLTLRKLRDSYGARMDNGGSPE